ncbi:hypothetical protein MHU86_24757 [Fragilaria crotonensis]|nr:hypothetical protein MHU86_24757 [Fragilaria crotonensis]
MKLTLLLLSCLTVVQGFSVVSPSSRRQLLDAAAASLAGSVLLPHAAHADVTNKVASSTAIRGVKRAQKLIDALELYVVNDQYLELMAAIREPPISEIRKACTTLVRGGEDGMDAEKLASSYQSFISSFEKLYTTAGFGVRGRKLKDGELLGVYKDSVTALASFVAVAEDSLTIPLQYSDEATMP